jgi:NTE family protein
MKTQMLNGFVALSILLQPCIAEAATTTKEQSTAGAAAAAKTKAPSVKKAPSAKAGTAATKTQTPEQAEAQAQDKDLTPGDSAGGTGGIPKEDLPSSEPTLPEGVERGPKVITNPAPAQTDATGATEIKDASPETKESVEESKLPKTISVPRGDGKKFSVKKVAERKTMAIALGGGGARGAAHIGVLKVLEQEKIPIDYIVGNSMGAIIGGGYAAGVPICELERRGLQGDMRKAYLPSVTTKILSMPFAKLVSMFKKEPAGIWSGKKFEKYLEGYLPKEVQCFNQTKIPFSAVATNLKDGDAYRISEGKLATAIRASATISPLLKPVAIDDKLYVDGGVRANLPASAARDTGADVVVAVLVDEPLRKLPDRNFRTFKGIAQRLADVVLAVTDEHQLQFADVIINPDVSGIPILSNEPEDVMKAIKAGEEAARKALPDLRKKLTLPASAQLVGQPLQVE